MAVSVGEITATFRMIDQLTPQLAVAQKQVGEFTKQVEGATGSAAGTGGKGGGLVEGLGSLRGALAGLGIQQAISRTIDFGSRLVDLSAQTGIAIEALQQLNAAGVVSGVPIDSLARGIGMLQRRLAGGEGDAVGAVEKLGLSLDVLLKSSPDAMFTSIAAEIAKIPDPAQRALVAFQLLGRSGSELIPVLVSDVKGLGESATVMSARTVEGLDRFDDAWAFLKITVMASIGNIIGGLASWQGATELFVKANTGMTVDVNKGLQESMAMWRQMGASVVKACSEAMVKVSAFATSFLSAKNQVVTYAQQLYTGVKTWMLDRFSAVVDGIKAKVGAVTGFFADMYDTLVGNSIIPDLMDRFGEEFGRLDSLMVAPTRAAASNVDSLFGQMLNTTTATLGNVLKESKSFGTEFSGVWSQIAQGLSGSIDSMISKLERLSSRGAAVMWSEWLKAALGPHRQDPNPPPPEGWEPSPTGYLPDGTIDPWGQYGPYGSNATAPRMADGGIVRKPTMAMIGESGPEAVIPLNQWDRGRDTRTTTVQLVLDGRTLAELLVPYVPGVVKRYRLA